MAIPFDYHSHNERCGHAAGSLADYIEAAKLLGLSDFGVSDHAPFLFFEGDDPAPGTAMAKSEYPDYVAEARALQERYKVRKRPCADQIAVRVGVEADFAEGFEAAYGEMLDAHPLDYALGSVHWVFGSHVFWQGRWETEDAERTYREYYRLTIAAVRSGLFDILAHATACEAYGPPIGEALADELYPTVVEAVRDAGMIAEINTSGFRKMGGEDPFPNRKMLRLFVEAGVPLTFGSDSHRPDEVGFAQGRVEALVRDLGLDVDDPRPVTVRRGPILAWTRF